MVADTTEVSWVDGNNGRLYFRGINIAELAAQATFEETSYLLIYGSLPTPQQLHHFERHMRVHASAPEQALRILKELPKGTQPLAALQTVLAALGAIETWKKSNEHDDLIDKGIRIIGQTAVIVSAAYRHSLGLALVEPRPDLNHAENFLYMLTGVVPGKKIARIMEIALIIQADHGFNPSTFVARAVASTLTNIYASTSAAVGALSGPLHGGASEKVVEMLCEAAEAADLDTYIQSLLLSGEKLMGMGHRVYKNFDPRALIFKDLLAKLIEDPTHKDMKRDWQNLQKIEAISANYFKKIGKPVFINVDFYSGALYKALGISPLLYPAIFATARTVGWVAHIVELRQNNRLYRPISHYTGKIDVPFIPLEERL